MNEKTLVKGKLICVALNDTAHLTQLSKSFLKPPHKEPPKQPVLYYKPRNTWCGHKSVIPWEVDVENVARPGMTVGASLGVVIGRKACRVKQENALEYLKGYTIVHDFSLPESSYYRPDIKGKCLDDTAPVGPSIVPVDYIDDYRALEVKIRINGSLKSSFKLRDLHRGPAELISIISYIMTLQPGEVVAVGFPGDKPAVSQGDSIDTTITEIGELSNSIEWRK